MNRLVGYIENWSFHDSYGIITDNDLKYIEPYTDVILSFIVLCKQADSRNPKLPDPLETFDGNFYYAGAPIISTGQVQMNTMAAKEFWNTTKGWIQKINGSKKVLLSIGGWFDLQTTPRLSTGKKLIDIFLQNISALLREVKIDGLDFDWEHLAVVGGQSVTQDEALDKCMFLGYLLASIKSKFGILVTYTTRSNSFYPYQFEGSNKSTWGSDREGYGVALGAYAFEKNQNMSADQIAMMYSYSALPSDLNLNKYIDAIHIMAYDGSVGKLASNNCYTNSDYSDMLQKTKVVLRANFSLVTLGFSLGKQAFPCLSSGAPCSSPCSVTNGDFADATSLSNVTPIFDIVSSYDGRGIFIWGANEFAGADPNCRQNQTCMADYSLAFAKAYLKYVKSKCRSCVGSTLVVKSLKYLIPIILLGIIGVILLIILFAVFTGHGRD